MRSFICKVFSFMLSLVAQVVKLVADTFIMIGTAAVEVLSEVLGALGTSILRNPLVLGVLAVGAYLIFFKEESDNERSTSTVAG